MADRDEFSIENEASIEMDENKNFLALSPQNSIKALQKVDALTKVVDGAVRLALQRTVAQDWVNMGGKWYLQASGVEKVRSVFGLYFKSMATIKETFADGTYAYITSGTAGCKLLDNLYGETTIQIEGCRSSADQFFSKQAVTDPMDVRRSSYANFTVRAAKALLGFGNYTTADLQAMGVKVGDSTKVTYEKGAEGGVKTGCISEPQAKRLWALCKANSISEIAIKKYLKETYSLDTSKNILRKDYETICNWVEAGGVTQPKRDIQAEIDELMGDEDKG
jgi:hypothetical protein